MVPHIKKNMDSLVSCFVLTDVVVVVSCFVLIDVVVLHSVSVLVVVSC
jgi:hypothetical protein